MTAPDTIAAIATAPGRSAIGIIRISGPQVAAIAAGVVGRPLAARRAVLAEFRDCDGAAIDRGLALFFPGPGSYTGEDIVELHGHGGPVVLRMLLERCVALGARLAQPGEFTRRAFLNGKLDLAQAESVIDLIDATTTQAARSAARSLGGVFSTEIQSLMLSLVELRALVEATLDFPEEEVDVVHGADVESRLKRAVQHLNAVLEAARQGSLLREGVQVVLAGAPNVGKSSLLNCLAGQDVAIVTDIPGTTRDTIREAIDVGGVPMHIMDTAGLRDPQDRVEQLGVGRSWKAIEQADATILVVDATRSETAADVEILKRLPPAQRRIRVMNKIDLIPRAPALERQADETRVWLSAKTGEGVNLLRDALLEGAGWQDTSESLFLARARHVEALRRARLHLANADRELGRPEIFAEELRLAHEALGAIVGDYTPDDLLGEIFSRFCIGK